MGLTIYERVERAMVGVPWLAEAARAERRALPVSGQMLRSEYDYAAKCPIFRRHFEGEGTLGSG